MTSLAVLARPCTRCGHQGAAHVAHPERNRDGWPVYDAIWRDASGACAAPGCPCPGRTSDTSVERIGPVTLPPARPRPVPVSGPCVDWDGHQHCGALPTRLYNDGPRCSEHPPGRRRPAPPR